MKNAQLADLLRPQTIDDIVGQKHLLGEGRPLRKIIESGDVPNLIFYGPSGVGKTTLATYIAKQTRKTLKKLNGTTASTADIKEIVAQLNTFHDTVVDQIPGVKHAMPMESLPAMVVALQSGAVDGYVAERPGAVADVTANPDLTFIEFEEGQGFVASEDDTAIAIGLKIGSPLLSQINDVLATLDQAAREQLMLDATARQPLNN